MHGVGVGKQVTYKRMSRLVVRNDATRLIVDNAILAFGASHQALHGLVDFCHANLGLVATGRKKRRLVHKVHQIGTGHAAGQLGDAGKVDIRADRLVLRVDLENLFTAAHVRSIHHRS